MKSDTLECLVLKSLSFLATLVLVKSQDKRRRRLGKRLNKKLGGENHLLHPKEGLQSISYRRHLLPDYWSGVFYYMSKKVMSPSMPSL